MTLSDMFPNITSPPPSGTTAARAGAFLLSHNKPDTWRHTAAVAQTARDIATQYGLDTVVAETAALLHDISSVISPAHMMAYAQSAGWTVDEAERRYPFLLHQRISAVCAREFFGIDNPEVLSAIECHSTLKRGASGLDMVLFVADKLSWDQSDRPSFYDTVADALKRSLFAASLAYINYMIDNKMLLHPHQWLSEAKNWLQC